jgi:hypothetical protein
MAAIDPSATPEHEDVDDKSPPRATLKVVRVPDSMFDDDDDDDEDYEELEDGEDEADEEENGGPSQKKSKAERLLEALVSDVDEEDDKDMADGEADEEDDEDDEEDEEVARAALVKFMKASKSKGKAKATGEEDEDEDDDDDDDTAIELDEVVLCTLDPEKVFHKSLRRNRALVNFCCRTFSSLWTLSSMKVKRFSLKYLALTPFTLPAITSSPQTMGKPRSTTTMKRTYTISPQTRMNSMPSTMRTKRATSWTTSKTHVSLKSAPIRKL